MLRGTTRTVSSGNRGDRLLPDAAAPEARHLRDPVEQLDLDADIHDVLGRERTAPLSPCYPPRRVPRELSECISASVIQQH